MCKRFFIISLTSFLLFFTGMAFGIDNTIYRTYVEKISKQEDIKLFSPEHFKNNGLQNSIQYKMAMNGHEEYLYALLTDSVLSAFQKDIAIMALGETKAYQILEKIFLDTTVNVSLRGAVPRYLAETGLHNDMLFRIATDNNQVDLLRERILSALGHANALSYLKEIIYNNNLRYTLIRDPEIMNGSAIHALTYGNAEKAIHIFDEILHDDSTTISIRSEIISEVASEAKLKTEPERKAKYSEYLMNLSNDQTLNSELKLLAVDQYKKVSSGQISPPKVITIDMDTTHALENYHNGKFREALELYHKAIDRFHKDNELNQLDEARLYSDISAVYLAVSDYNKAMEYAKLALSIRLNKLGENNEATANSYNTIGCIYKAQGQYDLALKNHQKALSIRSATLGQDQLLAAISYNNIGVVHLELGEYSLALNNFNKALTIQKTKLHPDHPDIAASYHQIGSAYDLMCDYSRALDYFNNALSLRTKKPDHPDTANSYNSIGQVYYAQHNFEKAIEYHKKALVIREKVLGPEHASTANSLNNLALQYETMGRYAEAEPLYKRALAIAANAGEPKLLRNVQENFSSLLKNQGKQEAAIFFAKQAVNITQDMRKNVAKIDIETLKTFQKTVESTYKRLSDLLIDAGRLPEAQQVMALLKQEEYFEYVRQDAKEEDVMAGRATYTGTEASLDLKYRQAADPLAILGAERGQLAELKLRTPDQEARLTILGKDLEKAGEAFQKVIEEITRELSEKQQGGNVVQIAEALGLQEDLRELGQGTVALYTLAGEEKYRVMLIAPDFRKAYQSAISEKEMNRKITALCEVLKDPRRDPRPLAKELYDLIIGPVVPDLTVLNAKTLMWSLDGALRYLPISALYDGKQYLVETYRNVVFTLASHSGLKDQPKPTWNGLGLGVSKPQPGFSELKAVKAEIDGIVRTDSSPQGVLPGLIGLDEAFTLDAMKQELRRSYPLVHIASHFKLTPGNDTQSFLLLGDGTHLPLSDIIKQTNLFKGVELLTLSACNTGVGDGKEVEGFGVLAQRQGAKGVIATLWPVDDASTGIFMQNFYRLREQEKLTKAEALQRAQLLFITGKTQGTSDTTQRATVEYTTPEGRDATAPAAPFTPNPAAPYSHPYYWAPFFLMGNWL